jgi:hypothetical protein
VRATHGDTRPPEASQDPGHPATVWVLKWAGLALVLVSCALLVYLGAVLLARLVLWLTYYSPDPEVAVRIRSWGISKEILIGIKRLGLPALL